jgi:hypothetical protein
MPILTTAASYLLAIGFVFFVLKRSDMKQLLIIAIVLSATSCGMFKKSVLKTDNESQSSAESTAIETTKETGNEGSTTNSGTNISTTETETDEGVLITITESEKITDYGLAVNGDTVPKRTTEKTNKKEYERKNKKKSSAAEESSNNQQIDTKSETKDNGKTSINKQSGSESSSETAKDIEETGRNLKWYAAIGAIVLGLVFAFKDRFEWIYIFIRKLLKSKDINN